MRKDIFTNYYKNNFWEGKESLSGPGSDYDQTKFLIPELKILLKEFDIKSMLDAPCGDFHWMKKLDLSGIEYVGADIVDELIYKNRSRYRNKTKQFITMDIVVDSIPKVDLVMVRDCLVHLPLKDVFSAINNIKDSGSKYLLTTNFLWKHLDCNYEIEVGGWRRLNLTIDPFNFPNPEYTIIEGNIQSNDRDKSMCLWQIKDIPYLRNIDG